MLVKDKHTQCYDEIIKNGSLTPYFFLFVPEKGGGIRDSQFPILDSRFLKLGGWHASYVLLQHRIFVLSIIFNTQTFC